MDSDDYDVEWDNEWAFERETVINASLLIGLNLASGLLNWMYNKHGLNDKFAL